MASEQQNEARDVRALVGVMVDRSTPLGAWFELTRVYDIRPNGVVTRDRDQSLLPLIASPSVMARLFYRGDSQKPYDQDSVVQLEDEHVGEFARRAYALVAIQSQLPALHRNDMERIVHELLGDSPVTSDAQDQISYEPDAVHARQRDRFERVRAEIASQYRQYSQHDQEMAARRASSTYTYVLYRADTDVLLIERHKVQPGFYFLAVPFRVGAVYPLEGGDWMVQRPFIMSVDYAELESVDWSQRVDADDPQRYVHSSTSGIIRGTPVLTTLNVDARRDPHAGRDVGIHVYSDFAARKVELIARRGYAPATYGYGRPARPEMAAEVWEERVMVSAADWEAAATDEERADYAAQASRDNPSGSPPRPGQSRRTMVRPHYLSVTWRLFALGDQDDVMKDHNFWARYIAHRALQEPNVVTTDQIPSHESLSIHSLPLVDKQSFFIERAHDRVVQARNM